MPLAVLRVEYPPEMQRVVESVLTSLGHDFRGRSLECDLRTFEDAAALEQHVREAIAPKLEHKAAPEQPQLAPQFSLGPK